MDKIEFDKINIILSEWNPIGVPEDISKSEYSSYIPKILSYKNDFLGLVRYIESILTNDFEFDYDKNDAEEKKEVLIVAFKIFDIINVDNIIN